MNNSRRKFTGRREHDFKNGDSFTEMLKKHGHIQDARKVIEEGIEDGSIQLNYSYKHPYNLTGMSGIPKYLKDCSTLMTLGLTGNLAATYLDPYYMTYTVISINSSTKSAQVQFYVSNSSTIASALRPPLIGYTKLWTNYIGKPLDNFFSKGMLSQTKQTFQWTESLKVK